MTLSNILFHPNDHSDLQMGVSSKSIYVVYYINTALLNLLE